ncbi:MAG: TerB family tellurite resistance protein [Methylococcaceae bacterium]|nr:TerB family tellurite resistance protein [Methylococcaceae bacterium]MCI0667563.1 TerB family tellurite resistance protein [Methylococcaceae bacterium]MCI0733005.1 TerB family tellurite resistance protein [Methylococcaceae bacterium]
MTSFLESLAEIFHEQLDRHRNRPFLNAAMAACALVATANGKVSFCQRIRIDQILETLDRLRGFDPHEGVDLFNDFVEKIVSSPKTGHEKALAAMTTVASEKPVAELLIRVCLAVSESDGKISISEAKEIISLCGVLGIEPGSVGFYPKPIELSDSGE